MLLFNEVSAVVLESSGARNELTSVVVPEIHRRDLQEVTHTAERGSTAEFTSAVKSLPDSKRASVLAPTG